MKIEPTESTFIIDNEVVVGTSNRDLSYAFGAPFQNRRVHEGNHST